MESKAHIGKNRSPQYLFAIGLLVAWLLAFFGNAAFAGGPKYVAGVSYFNPGVKGQPVHWAAGQLTYFVDQGPLNAAVSNAKAVAMVDSAAALWSAVPTAAVSLTDAGALAEDVNGANVLAGSGALGQPGDVAPTATSAPVAVIFDADGAVIDALEGTGASQPDNCSQNGVLVWIDNINPDATFAHGVIVLNGLCATSANLLAMMNYQLERAFGRLLGLDFSQVNDGAQGSGSTMPNGLLGWPVMLPENGTCGAGGGTCIPNPAQLRLDDIAALNRIYPVTSANQSSFPGKLLTAANTIAIQGTISFRGGVGMQGVNVVVRPLDVNGNPLYAYTVTSVSGAYFGGNHGNPVTGWNDLLGNRLDRFGSDDLSLQGYFDLSGIPLPPGVTVANYRVSFESMNPLYILASSVGPYILGSPQPSGAIQSVSVPGMQAGSSQTLSVVASSSAAGQPLPVNPCRMCQTNDQRQARPGRVGAYPVPRPAGGRTPYRVFLQRRNLGQPRSGVVKVRRPNSAGTESDPRLLPANGFWNSRIAQVGQTDWFNVPVRGNRLFTIVTQALDETGTPSMAKAMPAIGVWDGFDQVGTTSVGWAPAQNGFATGETWLQVATAGSEIVRMAVADQRGDGRPDYVYRGWVLYADTVSPARLPASGGTIVIRGTGFRAGDSVEVGGVAAQVVSILPTEITAVVPAATGTMTGSQDVEVDDSPLFNAMAVIPGGVSFDAGTGDALSLLVAPANQVPVNVAQPFTVLAEGADGAPAGGVTVLYSVTSGSATLACGQKVCPVTASGDGLATISVRAIDSTPSVVTASLTNGSSVQAHFYGGAAAALSAITPTLYLAAGASVKWPVQALAQSGGSPLANQPVVWQSASGILAPTSAAMTDAMGTAVATLTVGPLAKGQTATSNACLNGNVACVAFGVFGARPEFAALAAVSGTSQSLGDVTKPAPVTLRVLDMNGHPMAGGTVTINQALYAWAPACPAHGRCPQAQLLGTQAVTLTSALDGTVTLTPLSMPGAATNLIGLAATGNAGTLTFTVEQHP